MKKSRVFLFAILLLIACNNEVKKSEMKPYKFNYEALEKAVLENQAKIERTKRSDSTIERERFIFNNKDIYDLVFDNQSTLKSAAYFTVSEYDREREFKILVWNEEFYITGQRKKKTVYFKNTGGPQYEEEYGKDGRVIGYLEYDEGRFLKLKRSYNEDGWLTYEEEFYRSSEKEKYKKAKIEDEKAKQKELKEKEKLEN